MKQKPRHKDYVIVKRVMNKYYEENSPEFERVIELLLKQMELEISPNNIKEEEVKAYFDTFKQVDNKFGKINKLIDTLPKDQKKSLYLSYADDLIKALKNRVIPAIESRVSKKPEWNYNDPLIVAYLEQLLALIAVLRNSISKAREEKIDTITVTFSVLVWVYSLVLYGYLKEKLPPEITSRRYAELVVLVGPLSVKVSDNLEKIQSEFSLIPIVS
jgi:hypothetical protein